MAHLSELALHLVIGGLEERGASLLLPEDVLALPHVVRERALQQPVLVPTRQQVLALLRQQTLQALDLGCEGKLQVLDVQVRAPLVELVLLLEVLLGGRGVTRGGTANSLERTAMAWLAVVVG